MSIQVDITGDVQVVNYLKRIGNEIETHVMIPAMRDWAEALREAMLKREHYRSGRMKSMTKVNTAGKYWAVVVAVHYAEQENRRPGDKRGRLGGGQGTPHQFVEPSMQEVEKPQLSNLSARINQFLAAP